MDGEVWASRMSATKRRHFRQQLSSQPHSDRPLSLDDQDGEDDTRSEFSCPFCYEDFDIASLCSHLEDEHCYESKSAACPVCAAKVGKDVVGHIALQHGHLFKMQRRRRFRKAGSSSTATLSLLGKDLREAQLLALLGVNSSRSGASTSNTGADPLLSTIVYNLPNIESEDVSKSSASGEESSTKNSSLIKQHRTSLEASLTAEEREQKLEEATLRAKFVQQMVLSIVFSDS